MIFFKFNSSSRSATIGEILIEKLTLKLVPSRNLCVFGVRQDWGEVETRGVFQSLPSHLNYKW